uniref:Uncharacterized protein n=1 Tax=Cacopsylla melanoneura TaxID=428564 RepID=A0A8D9FB31_9HEMI
MDVQAMVLAIWATVIVLMDTRERTVRKAFVQSFVPITANMVVAFVIVRTVGKVQSVIFLQLIVNIQTVQVMGAALKDFVNVNQAGKGLDVRKSTVSILSVPTMVFVTKANVSVRQDGKVSVVSRLTSKCFNVYPLVLNMGCMI